MYEEKKTIKLSNKIKLRPLKEVLDLCLKKKINIYIDNGYTVRVETADYDAQFSVNEFNKTYTLDHVEIEYNYDGDITSEEYYAKSRVFDGVTAFMFTGFPKLSKKQKKPIPLPPGPETLRTLRAGKGHESLDIEYRDNGTLKVGCSDFSKDQVENTFKFLGDCLGYDIEK